MGVMTLSAAAYARMMKLLLPPGRIWRLDPDSNLSKVLLACGDELERVSGRAQDIVEEADPRTTSELLPDFERVLSLDSTGTDAARRARVEARLVLRQRVRPVDFQQALAALLGQAVVDVVVIERGSLFAFAIDDQREIYRFFIYRDPTDPGTYSIADAQVEIDRIAPSHTKGHAIESIAFECNDPFSLCNRDLLGGSPSVEFRKSAVAAFREAIDRKPTILCVGQLNDLITHAALDASGTATTSTLTGVSEAFGTDAYDFDGSGGAVFESRETVLGGVPADESRAYFVIFRPRAIPVSGALAGKQDGGSEGFNFLFSGSLPRFTSVSDSATTNNQDLTVTSAVNNDWRCLCAIFDRTNNEIRFASDLEAASDVVLPAERYDPPTEPLRIGDSRTPPSVVSSTDCEIGLFAEVQEDVDTLDAQVAAAALLAKFTTA